MTDHVKIAEEAYDIKLPEEYVDFLSKEKFKKFNNMYCANLPNGRNTQPICFVVDDLIFGMEPDEADLEEGIYDMLLVDLDDFLPGGDKHIIPFAAFAWIDEGDVDSGALVIDTKKCKDEKCPIFLISDSEIEKVSDSIAEFLETLASECHEDQ